MLYLLCVSSQISVMDYIRMYPQYKFDLTMNSESEFLESVPQFLESQKNYMDIATSKCSNQNSFYSNLVNSYLTRIELTDEILNSRSCQQVAIYINQLAMSYVPVLDVDTSLVAPVDLWMTLHENTINDYDHLSFKHGLTRVLFQYMLRLELKTSLVSVTIKYKASEYISKLSNVISIFQFDLPVDATNRLINQANTDQLTVQNIYVFIAACYASKYDILSLIYESMVAMYSFNPTYRSVLIIHDVLKTKNVNWSSRYTHDYNNLKSLFDSKINQSYNVIDASIDHVKALWVLVDMNLLSVQQYKDLYNLYLQHPFKLTLAYLNLFFCDSQESCHKSFHLYKHLLVRFP